MPGLLRGVARTAMVAGTATAVSNRVSRRQGQRWAMQDAQYASDEQYAPPQPVSAPPSGGGAAMDRIAALKELAELKAQGVLTDAEFEAEKGRILGS
ncbi:SHOCT domain-containing protein [Nocardia asiatica]|uniref:SHOCT domain-containing protein n=1 Tax=Nocardia asiatica TaxID=209252 RepID=UPI003EE1A0D9